MFKTKYKISDMEKEKVNLHDWQKVVVDYVASWDDMAGEQSMQSVGDFERNSRLSIIIKMYKNAGHTFLTSYLANLYPSTIIYHDMAHWRQIDDIGAGFDFEMLPVTQAVSVFEIYHGITEMQSNMPSIGLQKLKQKVRSSNIVVVDKASELSKTAKEWLMNVSPGPLIFLG